MPLRPRWKAIPRAVHCFPSPEAPNSSTSTGAKKAPPAGDPNYSAQRRRKQHTHTSMHSTRSNKLKKFMNKFSIYYYNTSK
jgi:hypothetical protein